MPGRGRRAEQRAVRSLGASATGSLTRQERGVRCEGAAVPEAEQQNLPASGAGEDERPERVRAEGDRGDLRRSRQRLRQFGRRKRGGTGARSREIVFVLSKGARGRERERERRSRPAADPLARLEGLPQGSREGRGAPPAGVGDELLLLALFVRGGFAERGGGARGEGAFFFFFFF